MPDPIEAVASATVTSEVTPEERRNIFLRNWAKMLGLPPDSDVFAIVCDIINTKKNFQTATCLLFGLSVRTHKDWIIKAAEYWRKNWEDGSICTKEWLITFQQWYISDLEGQPYPTEA